MKKEFKSIDQLIKEKNTFISAIPNNMGINLCSVKGIEYIRQKDGQLLSMKIIFIPADLNPLQLELLNKFEKKYKAEKAKKEKKGKKLSFPELLKIANDKNL